MPDALAPRTISPTAPAPGTIPSAAPAAADPALAVAYFAGRLAFETDVSDVAADLEAGTNGIIVVDTRSREAWDQGHVPGAVHVPTREIARRAAEVTEDGATVVVYCWGPGCNGATKAALEFARLGHPVKEMIGGFEYWAGGVPRGAGDGGDRAAGPRSADRAGRRAVLRLLNEGTVTQ